MIFLTAVVWYEYPKYQVPCSRYGYCIVPGTWVNDCFGALVPAIISKMSIFRSFFFPIGLCTALCIGLYTALYISDCIRHYISDCIRHYIYRIIYGTIYRIACCTISYCMLHSIYRIVYGTLYLVYRIVYGTLYIGLCTALYISDCMMHSM